MSSDYGVDFVKTNNNIAGTITPHHMLLTKKDVFKDEEINPHHYCMPVVKNENDLMSLRKAACFNNSKFFWVLTQRLIMLIIKNKMTL